jgi:MOSC domain-containing protein YiiM
MRRRPDTGEVVAVCAGVTAPAPWLGDGEHSGIDKRAIDGPAGVGHLGIEGDEQGDTANHGGRDQALYAYAQEDADHWVAALDRDLPPGRFGENLRTVGIDVSTAPIGTRWRLGSDVEVEVTAPRIPCRTFAGFWDVPDLVSRFLSAGRPGAYLRVLAPGTVHAGDPIEIVDVPDHDVTVADAMRIATRDRHLAARLLEIDGTAERVREWAEKQVAATG